MVQNNLWSKIIDGHTGQDHGPKNPEHPYPSTTVTKFQHCTTVGEVAFCMIS